mmetsp:Transcript_17866/g.41660  ORF Transcript_17866/g.41660 Transcript_17866/m.41660 type:complete len:254 (-) Transcript_17866:324-1085(-)
MAQHRPLRACLPVHRRDQEQRPSWDSIDSLSHGFTLKGAAISEAILRGLKDVENRNIRLPLGWMAVHTGMSKPIQWVDDALRQSMPRLASQKELPKGAVVGVCWIERAVRLEDLRAEYGCGPRCEARHPGHLCHVPSCEMSPHAIGPMCNVISAAIRLPNPVKCKGDLGCWKLDPYVKRSILRELRKVEEEGFPKKNVYWPSRGRFPKPWPAPGYPEGFKRWVISLPPPKKSQSDKTKPAAKGKIRKGYKPLR